MPPLVVVTGAGRSSGIGFEVARQLASRKMRVIVTARQLDAARGRAAELVASGYDAHAVAVDITSDSSVAVLRSLIEEHHGGVLDILVNNAAGTSIYGELPSSTNLDHARATMEATLFGTWRLTRALLPLLRASQQPRIVNVSSGAGSHGDPIFGLTTANAMGPAYAISKAALNALTATLATELATTRILVNAVCPGFTATFPGGEEMGARPVRDGAASVVWAALLPDDGPRGGLFRDGKPIPW